MRFILTALVALFALAAPASAGKQEYSLALVGVSGGQAEFSVSRTDSRNTRIVYVQTECYDASGEEWYERDAVLWGQWDSLVGSSAAVVSGVWCEAYITTDPHYRQPKSNIVEFQL